MEEDEGVGTSGSVVCGSFVVPGDLVTTDGAIFMSGHGTYQASNECLYASVAGTYEQVNKLLHVKPFKNRYIGEVGDVVVGRIVEVQQKRWKVDTNSRLHSVLLSSSLMLPTGELRIKSAEDELMMRKYFQEGDLISAEVQSVFQDGSLSLQTRTVQFGKLGQGVFIAVPQYLVKRRKNHFHDLPCGASMILGCNGYIWLCPPANLQASGQDDDEQMTGSNVGAHSLTQSLTQAISVDTRHVLARLHNCIRLLADHSILLFNSSVMHAYNASLQFQTSDLLRPDISDQIAEDVRQRVNEEAM